MTLRLGDAHRAAADALDAELRAGAEAIGVGLQPHLRRLAPGLTRPREGDAGEADATLLELDLERDGEPDALSLVACLAAHRGYVASRGEPDGVSAGALAIARLLVWGQRAAMLGPAPRIEWIGPAARRPEAGDRLALSARCALEMGGATRRAEAVALIARP
ncbi:hypothetical protein [Miltoncostaea marina]|uniref:hypothetical protein n=1 Tax=Miltoncostaea marina TaxID=2843215 RepID=UPI001C3D795E|nr:hypothetical protein [Miltoncostaea marina]